MNHRTIAYITENESGVALLITLSIIAILFTVSMELNRRVRIAVMAAEAGKTGYELISMAESGINVAEAILVKDANTNNIDSVQEKWARQDTMDRILNSLGFNKDNIKLKITDEMGKLQVNALINEYPGHSVNPDQKKIWQNLLSLFISSDKSEDKRDAQEIINSLIDWLDDRDGEVVTGTSGAESSYYESLKTPYKCSNKNFSNLNELLFVKGISKKLFFKARNLSNVLSNTEEQDDNAIQFSIDDLLTVSGADRTQIQTGKGKYHFTGKININTAPMPVVAAILPFGKQDLAKEICTFRIEKPEGGTDYSNDLSQKNWYADVAGLTEKETAEINKIVTTSSNIFSIKSYACLGKRSIVLTRIIERRKDKEGRWYCKTLRQRIE